MLALALMGCSSNPGSLFGIPGHDGSGGASGSNTDSAPDAGGTFNMGGAPDATGTVDTGGQPSTDDTADAGGEGGAVGQLNPGGSSGTSNGGTAGAGGNAAGGPSEAMDILSIDFVGGSAADTLAMLPAEIAGAKPASHWNGASGSSGSLLGLMLADGSATLAAVAWNSSGTFSVGFVDAPGDVRMMNGYLDPDSADSPAMIKVTALPTRLTTQGYDVYVYAYGEIPASAWMRTYHYSIAGKSIALSQSGPSEHAFSGYAAAPANGAGNYVVFRNLSASSFTLLATPGVASNGAGKRAPVNGIQIVSPSGS